jgi:hypothetical protein
MAKLAQCLNKTILVSIPAFFGDEQPQPCTLIDIEISGLWLAGEEIANALPFDDERPDWLMDVGVFFPYSQIAYLYDPAQFARLTLREARARLLEAPPRAKGKESFRGKAQKQQTEKPSANKPPKKKR